MKTLFKLFCCSLIFWVASIGTTFAEGGTGVAGGADHTFDIYKLLPEKIEVIAVYSHPFWESKPIVMGKKYCFGFIPCSLYAWQAETLLTFSKTMFHEKGKGVDIKTFGIADRYRAPISPEVVNGLVEKKTIFTSPMELIFEDSERMSFAQFRYIWDGTEISKQELDEKLSRITNATLAQISLPNYPETVSNVLIVNRFFQDLSVPIQISIDAQIIAFTKRREELALSLAGRAIDDSHQCDIEQYSWLKSVISNWVVGTPKWNDNLKVQTGHMISQEVVREVFSSRGRVLQYLADFIEPYCGPKAHNADPQRVPRPKDEIILEESDSQ